jgi:hypothetical protein
MEPEGKKYVQQTVSQCSLEYYRRQGWEKVGECGQLVKIRKPIKSA